MSTIFLVNIVNKTLIKNTVIVLAKIVLTWRSEDRIGKILSCCQCKSRKKMKKKVEKK